MTHSEYPSAGPVRHISADQARALWNSDPRALVLDVRETAEYQAGHIPGARSFPLGQITRRTAGELATDPDTPLLLYCQSGLRSRRAAALLAGMGYRQVYEFGGICNWPYGLEK